MEETSKKSNRVTCPECRGRGKDAALIWQGGRWTWGLVPCKRCNGEKEIEKENDNGTPCTTVSSH